MEALSQDHILHEESERHFGPKLPGKLNKNFLQRICSDGYEIARNQLCGPMVSEKGNLQLLHLQHFSRGAKF